ncbi:uncharacterized protein LOC110006567 [Amborella trichopoda]|uniref:uncharacterized protein LOC110006567 n=1 Tax=Amborella trichopoda TaxID=13333 RepID=UPI0009BE2086|nr:uncharacterized protein LOC110006567 [Amborella trichopoda]|eukprot:XP_020518092.1 uncharacterized protein LOC110006567 [Amborella trichopoda]
MAPESLLSLQRLRPPSSQRDMFSYNTHAKKMPCCEAHGQEGSSMWRLQSLVSPDLMLHLQPPSEAKLMVIGMRSERLSSDMHCAANLFDIHLNHEYHFLLRNGFCSKCFSSELSGSSQTFVVP